MQIVKEEGKIGMTGLIYKEFAIQKKNLLMMMAALTIVSLILFVPAGSSESLMGTFLSVFGLLVYIYAFMLTGMYQPSIFEIDERKKWAYFMAASPLTAKGQVASKYLFTLIVSIFTVIWCTTVNNLQISISNGGVDMTMMLVCMFSIQIFLRAVEYPFIVKIGSKNGGMVKTISFVVIFMLIVIYLLFGKLPHVSSMDELFDWIVNVVNGSAFSENVLFLISIFPFISALLYWLSYKISCRFYLEGAEAYEK